MRVTVTKAEQDWRVSVNDRVYSSFPDETAAQMAADRLAAVLRSCDLPVRCSGGDPVPGPARGATA